MPSCRSKGEACEWCEWISRSKRRKTNCWTNELKPHTHIDDRCKIPHCTSPSLYWPGQYVMQKLRSDCFVHRAGEAFDSCDCKWSKHGYQQETSSQVPFTEAHTHISTPSFRVKDNCLAELDNIGLCNISGPPYLYHPEKSSSSRSASLPIPHIVNALATSLSVLMARN